MNCRGVVCRDEFERLVDIAAFVPRKIELAPPTASAERIDELYKTASKTAGNVEARLATAKMADLYHIDNYDKDAFRMTIKAAIATTVVEPYIVLCIHSLLKHTDVTEIMNNEAPYNICGRNLDIERSCPQVAIAVVKP